MSTPLRNTLVILVIIIAAAALVLVGIYFGRAWYGYGHNGMMGFGLYNNDARLPYGMGPDMMGSQDFPGASGYWGPGMMRGHNPGGMMGQGMMGGYGFFAGADVEPLTLEQAEAAVESYLQDIGTDDLTLGEIMIFDNHAYAQILEVDTGLGAMEVIVDPITGSVSPEHGPNMMWNLKYSPMGMMRMMGGYGPAGHSGMMGSLGTDLDDPTAEMPISAEIAVETAQAYLEAYQPELEADEHADTFYGYYTLHTLEDGQTAGMLSVNGYTGQVFMHTWHGEFIEMSESH